MEMFGDNLGIGFPSDQPIIFNIKSPEATAGFIEFFNYFWKQEVSVDSGIAALRRVMFEMLGELNAGEEYFVLGASIGSGADDAVQKFYDEFHRERIKKGVIVKLLAYKESLARIKKRFADFGDPAGKISVIKSFVAAPPIPMQINLFKNKTRLVIYGAEPVVILFDRPEIFANFKIYFDKLWK